jgi:hypothetical protein
VGNVAANLVALMCGIVSFVIAAIEAYWQKPLIAHFLGIAGGICLLAAFDQAYQDKHRNSQVFIEQSSSR